MRTHQVQSKREARRKSVKKSFKKFINFASFIFNFSHGTERIQFVFSSDNFYPFIEELAFGASDFLGALGGLMGLFAGISVVSVIEVGFHFLRLFVEKVSDRRRLKVHAIKVVETVNKTHPTVGRRTLQYFVKIVLKSDIHGIHFLVEGGRKIWEKVFWVLVVFASSIFCSFQIFEVIKYSELNPIEFGIDERIWTINDVSSKLNG